MLSGLVFNLQKYSVHDGPGIRTTVFLKGCPLHCAWCHNPESISRKPQILLLENRCLGCRECVRACPHADCAPATGPMPVQNAVCDLCGSCIDACVTTARQMAGRKMTVREVMKAVLQDQIFYGESGGGVTFSGGEPLAQPEFLQALLEACRHEGLHTAVDTCGLVRREHLLAAAPLTDVFLYDLKLMDDAKHREYTGSSNAPILENLQALGPVARNIWIRVPIIPGVNADDANLNATARFAAGIPNVRQVNLLPYHRMGTAKTQRPGSTANLADMEPPTPELMRRAVEIVAAYGLTVKTGG
jgi:pyruvate formate lyase activating enzyme